MGIFDCIRVCLLRKKMVILCWLLSAVLFNFYTISSFCFAAASKGNPVGNALDIISKHYAMDVDEDQLIDVMVRAAVRELDQYSYYVDVSEYQQAAKRHSDYGVVSAIGAVVKQSDERERLHIVHIYDDSPASAAGLEVGDVILSLCGVDVQQLGEVRDISDIRCGDVDGIDITVRSQDGDVRSVVVKRGVVEIPSVSGKMIEDSGLIYLKVSYFDANTAKNLEKIYTDLCNSDVVNGVVLDLRDNSGGLLHSVLDVADLFLQRGEKIMLVQRGRSKKLKTYRAKKGVVVDRPVVVLLNGKTASAAEVLVFALRENDKVSSVIGTRSYGKGRMQELFDIGGGRAINITTALYYTPKGNMVDGSGVEPDMLLNESVVGSSECIEVAVGVMDKILK